MYAVVDLISQLDYFINMITDDDVKKIRNALKPVFDSVEQKVRKALLPEIDKKLSSQTKEIKQYIHEGVDAVVEGVDNLLSEYKYDERISKLEKIHPQGRHSSID